MIAVIADDLTGAAELGGLALQYNLRIEINTEVNSHSHADLLIIAADTRSKMQAEAVAEMKEITRRLALLKPQLIFKKIDSVLRGHVLPEINVHLEVLQLKRALIVSANPSLGRTIKNGVYYFNNQPIHQSSFAHDPEFPITSSQVTHMLRANGVSMHVIHHKESLPETGIFIGEVESNEDLKAWTQHVDATTFIAGAAGFFAALLQSLNLPPASSKTEVKIGAPALFICGSTFQNSRISIQQIKENGGPVSYMPTAIVAGCNPSKDAYENWSKEIISLLKNGSAIIAIDANTTKNISVTAADLRQKMATIVQKVFEEIDIPELFIEGGSTAAAVLKQLQFTRLTPIREMAPGVIRLHVDIGKELFLTIKPGSYHWPSAIWNFNQ